MFCCCCCRCLKQCPSLGVFEPYPSWLVYRWFFEQSVFQNWWTSVERMKRRTEAMLKHQVKTRILEMKMWINNSCKYRSAPGVLQTIAAKPQRQPNTGGMQMAGQCIGRISSISTHHKWWWWIALFHSMNIYEQQINKARSNGEPLPGSSGSSVKNSGASQKFEAISTQSVPGSKQCRSKRCCNSGGFGCFEPLLLTSLATVNLDTCDILWFHYISLWKSTLPAAFELGRQLVLPESENIANIVKFGSTVVIWFLYMTSSYIACMQKNEECAMVWVFNNLYVW